MVRLKVALLLSSVVCLTAGLIGLNGCGGGNNNQQPPPSSPVLTITKSHFGNFPPGGTGSYTIVVTNTGSAATSGNVTVTDTLPNGLTPTNAPSGTGWTCTLSPLSCNRSDALAPNNQLLNHHPDGECWKHARNGHQPSHGLGRRRAQCHGIRSDTDCRRGTNQSRRGHLPGKPESR